MREEREERRGRRGGRREDVSEAVKVFTRGNRGEEGRKGKGKEGRGKVGRNVVNVGGRRLTCFFFQMSQVIPVKNSTFLMSKPDQLSNVPYHVLTEAFGCWIDSILSLESER
jgi:hypothetical protein